MLLYRISNQNMPPLESNLASWWCTYLWLDLYYAFSRFLQTYFLLVPISSGLWHFLSYLVFVHRMLMVLGKWSVREAFLIPASKLFFLEVPVVKECLFWEKLSRLIFILSADRISLCLIELSMVLTKACSWVVSSVEYGNCGSYFFLFSLCFLRCCCMFLTLWMEFERALLNWIEEDVHEWYRPFA